jgi:hypothetical protein
MVVNPTLQYILYEALAARALAWRAARQQAGHGGQRRPARPHLPARHVFALSALSKLGATLATYPLLVVKNRLQVGGMGGGGGAGRRPGCCLLQLRRSALPPPAGRCSRTACEAGAPAAPASAAPRPRAGHQPAHAPGGALQRRGRRGGAHLGRRGRGRILQGHELQDGERADTGDGGRGGAARAARPQCCDAPPPPALRPPCNNWPCAAPACPRALEPPGCCAS